LKHLLHGKNVKLKKKKQELVKEEEKKRTDFVKHGRLLGLSGREMFTFNPDLIANDDEDADNDIDYRHRSDDEEEEDDEENNNEINEQASAIRKPAIREFNDIELLALEAREVDNTGTIASEDRFENYRKLEHEKQERRQAAAAQAALAEEANKLDQACGGRDVASASASTYDGTINNDEDDDSEDEEVQIDEDLFADDLDDVEEQLRETDFTS